MIKSKFIKINIFSMIFLNLKFENIVKRLRDKRIILVYKYCRIVMDKSSRIINHDIFKLGEKENIKSKVETCLKLGKNSILEVKGNFSIFNGADIRIFDNAKLTLGSGYFAKGCEVSCKKSITIGNNVAIARGVIIRDTDAHEIIGNKRDVTESIVIGDNVWIGNRAVILKGVEIGSGSVIAAGAIVTKSIPKNSIVAGIPAKVIKSNIEWRI